MKNFNKLLITLCLAVTMFVFVSCGGATPKSPNETMAEKIELSTATIGEINFENSKLTSISQNEREFTVTGSIEQMSLEQQNAFGDKAVKHVVVLKYIFDKERTIDEFEIAGKNTKVYSTDKSVKNYVGSITDLLDNDDGEDAYTNLILSAETKEYIITAKYSDGEISKATIKIQATLVGTGK